GDALLLSQPSSGRSPLVALDDVWYACVLGSDEVAVIDSTALAVVGAASAVGSCSGLAIDPIRTDLLVSSYAWNQTGGVSRFSLADPLSPLLIDHPHSGEATLIAGNGAIVALADPGPFAANAIVSLLDPADLSVRGTFDAGSRFFGEAFGDLVFASDRLFVQSKGQLSVWDVRDPTAPMQLFAVDRSGVGNGSNTPPANALATD